jgi:sulfide:quinone oxidoreductase
MQPKPLTPTLSVAAQIQPQDVAQLAAAGYRAILCNRPDGEEAGQPPFADIAAAATAAGLETAYQPIVTAALGPDDAHAFAALIDRLPGPILAYCRSGTRSATLWTMVAAGQGTAPADIAATTSAAGYDMSQVLRRIAPTV